MIADLPPDTDAVDLTVGQTAEAHVGDGAVRAGLDVELGDECDPLLDVATDVDLSDETAFGALDELGS